MKSPALNSAEIGSPQLRPGGEMSARGMIRWLLIAGWRMVKWMAIAAILLLLAAVGTVAGVSLWIQESTEDAVYRNSDKIPPNEVGVVLGTSRFLDNAGLHENLHFRRRMEAAAALYHKGKVRRFIVSGAVDPPYYDEPREMKRVLVDLGVLPEAIETDPAGFRTLDSIVRAKNVFHLDRFTIISDRFHTYRAVFIARHFELDVAAFAAQEIDTSLSWKAKFREQLANIKALLDLYILNTQPRVEPSAP